MENRGQDEGTFHLTTTSTCATLVRRVRAWGLRQRALAFPNQTGHGAPHEPPRKLLRQSGNPFHDDSATSNSSVVLVVSQPNAVEEREIRTDDKIGVEPGRRHTHRNLAGLEQ